MPKNLLDQANPDPHALQPYCFTVAQHQLNAIETRIMALIMLELKDAQIENFETSAEEDMEKLGAEECLKKWDKYSVVELSKSVGAIGENYTAVKNALKSLTTRRITITTKTKKTTIGSVLVNWYLYEKNFEKIKIKVFPLLVPELIYLGKNYTNYGLSFLFLTKSAYAMRWYQIAHHWINQGTFTMPKEDIRNMFGLEDKYPRHVDFHRRIIADPFKEINELSDIDISVQEVHREWREVVGYTFRVERKRTKPKIPTEPVLDLEGLPDYIRSYLAMFDKGLRFQCHKSNLDYERIRARLLSRGVPTTAKTQVHFFNMTHKWLAVLIKKEGDDKRSTIPEIIATIKG